MPKMVSARPVATWLASSVSVSTREDQRHAPCRPAPPATMPSAGCRSTQVTAKPVTAPTSIMPSTPRLSTPERSTTSSPMAASSSGVAALMIVSRTGRRAIAGHAAARPAAGRGAATQRMR